MFVESTNHKGNVAELAIVAEAARLGISVLKPLTEHERYDLVFGVDRRLMRVQCKWGNLKDGVIGCNLTSSRTLKSGYVRQTYTVEEIDAVAVYCAALDRCFLLPASIVAGIGYLHLRLDPPKNSQRAAINWAADYELGAVAQLAERLHGMQEARGSNPLSSTTEDDGGATVGAHEFRNLFGWYIQRAAAGESFLVTRRGKPFARLSPP